MTKTRRDQHIVAALTLVGLAASSMGTPGLGAAGPPQIEGGCPEAKTLPAPSYDSFFGRQPPVETESPTWRVTLKSTDASPRYGVRFLFQVTDKRTGALSKFALCDPWTRQVDEIDVVDDARALVLGRAAGAGLVQATVVELPAGKVVDHFACFRPVLSPRHRFLAFIKDFPPHPGPAVIGWEYIVYDLSESRDYNRPHIKPGVTYDAGWPVYPRGATNAVGENVLPEGSPYHSWTSGGLFWLDEHTLTFTDFFQGRNLLVVADLSRGVRDPKVRALPLDSDRLVDLDQCKKSTAPSDFEVWSKEPAGLIQVTQIVPVPGKPGMACLHFVPSPCLKQTNLMVKLR